MTRAESGVTRAELVRHGFAVRGRPQAAVLAEVTDDDVRRAACEELCGYWARAARRPLWWLSPVIADLGLTSMARGRYALETGQLLTKTQAIERADARALAERPAPCPAAGRAGGLAAGPDRADRVARCPAHRGRRTPQGTSLKSRIRLGGRHSELSRPNALDLVWLAIKDWLEKVNSRQACLWLLRSLCHFQLLSAVKCGVSAVERRAARACVA